MASYSKQEWINSPTQTTPINADRLNHIEDGIYNASMSEINLMMLGWDVPSECPIQNTVSGNTFTQKVGRVDLGSLDWNKQYTGGHYSFYNNTVKPATKGANAKANIICNLLTTQTSSNVENNGAYGISVDNAKNIVALYSNTDNSSSTVDDFKSAMSGVYLYYELATPITKTIDGNEAIVAINSNLLNKQNKLTQGSFVVTTIANVQKEVTSATISSGTLPPNDNTFFVIVGISSTNNCYNDIHYYGGKIIVYSNVAQNITVKWFNFS